MKKLTTYTDASAKAYLGKSKNKPLLKMPIKKTGTVSTAQGPETFVVVEVYGECQGCSEKVWYGRTEPGKQWVPLIEINDEDGIYKLHRCEGELKRNAMLQKLVYGEKKISR